MPCQTVCLLQCKIQPWSDQAGESAWHKGHVGSMAMFQINMEHGTSWQHEADSMMLAGRSHVCRHTTFYIAWTTKFDETTCKRA